MASIKIFDLCMETLNIVLMTDSDGDPICGPFLTLPSKKEYPDYYDDIEKPIALDKIRTKVIKGKYRNLHQMEEDIVLMCNNAREYNVEGTELQIPKFLVVVANFSGH